MTCPPSPATGPRGVAIVSTSPATIVVDVNGSPNTYPRQRSVFG